jgi:hypothetical protein
VSYAFTLLLQLSIISQLFIATNVSANQQLVDGDPIDKAWFEGNQGDDSLGDENLVDDNWPDESVEEQSLAINEGVLTFISPVTDRLILHSDIKLAINHSSLEDGWVKLKQCYKNIHPVSETDIVYQYKQIRNLNVISKSSIDSLGIDGQVIQLKGVTDSASLCVKAEVNLLEKQVPEPGQGKRYTVSSGPYHLRFFDGYYPFHLTLAIEYPEEDISLISVSPASEELFEITDKQGVISVDTWFEGELKLHFVFNSIDFDSND